MNAGPLVRLSTDVVHMYCSPYFPYDNVLYCTAIRYYIVSDYCTDYKDLYLLGVIRKFKTSMTLDDFLSYRSGADGVIVDV